MLPGMKDYINAPVFAMPVQVPVAPLPAPAPVATASSAIVMPAPSPVPQPPTHASVPAVAHGRHQPQGGRRPPLIPKRHQEDAPAGAVHAEKKHRADKGVCLGCFMSKSHKVSCCDVAAPSAYQQRHPETGAVKCSGN